MNLLRYATRLYSLHTLDTRFTTSSKNPFSSSRVDPARPSPDEAPYDKGKSEADELVKGANPPRWRSAEFIYHGLVFLVAVPLIFKTAYDVSKRKHAFPFHHPVLQTDITTQRLTKATPSLPLFCHLAGFPAARSTTRTSSMQLSETIYHTSSPS